MDSNHADFFYSYKMPSNLNSAILFCRPPPYPVNAPFTPTTRWQGTIIPIGFHPTATPTACADIQEFLFLAAIFFAIEP